MLGRIGRLRGELVGQAGHLRKQLVGIELEVAGPIVAERVAGALGRAGRGVQRLSRC